MKYSILAAAVLLFAVSCKKEDKPTPATVATFDFVVNGSPTQGNYDFFSFATGAKVAATDSNSTKWDFAMRFETFIINSNASGPGNAGVQIVNTPFDNVTAAPETGYKYDTTVSQKAIKGSDWYVYAGRSFSPIAGKTFVFRTATNKFAKLEVISADALDASGNILSPTSPVRPASIKYKIRFAYQPGGKRDF
ncbi:MAG: HmuY family protein [Chitinophagaceae bacterium]|nr:HmuY family protein [Chitinophagaceae bacterium]